MSEPDYAATWFKPDPATALYVVWFEDADRQPVTFFGSGAEKAARTFYEQSSKSWNCYLLVDSRAAQEHRAQIEAASVLEQVRAEIDADPERRAAVNEHKRQILIRDYLASEDAEKALAEALAAIPFSWGGEPSRRSWSKEILAAWSERLAGRPSE